MIDWSVAIESYLELRSIAPAEEEEELRSTRVYWSVAIVSHASHAHLGRRKMQLWSSSCTTRRNLDRVRSGAEPAESDPSRVVCPLEGRRSSTATAAAGGGIAPSSPAVRRVLHGQRFFDCYCCC